MEIAYRVLEGVPPLSWCACLPEGGTTLQVSCGRAVHTRPDSFFEGAWDGDFPAGDFDLSPHVFGSGVRIRGDRCILVPPSHTLERLFVLPRRGAVWASNSLCFLLARTGEELDHRYHDYVYDFCSIMKGLDHFHLAIPTKENQVHVIHYRNIRLSPGGAMEYLDKPGIPHFSSFRDYVLYLQATLQSVIRNGRHPARPGPYQPLGTLSAGYDSTATMALLRSLGVESAISFVRHDAPPASSDSGEAAAAYLGVRQTLRKNDEYLARQDCPEAEFFAAGFPTDDFSWAVFEKELGNRLFFTGLHGDTIWSTGGRPNEQMKRGDVAFMSLGEFRLRVNFIHVPVPLIGALRHPDIDRITRSDEMKPYSIGGSYDRPIARRIAEEAGIPRTAFAREKLTPANPQLSERTLREIREYPRFPSGGQPARAPVTRRAGSALSNLGAEASRQVIGVITRYRILHHIPLAKDRLKRFGKKRLWNSYRSESTNRRFFWGFDRTIGRYTLRTEDESGPARPEGRGLSL